MDQQSEMLQVLKEIRADTRAQAELAKTAYEEAKVFREQAMRLQKRGSARVFWTMAVLGLLLGLTIGACAWFIIKDQK